MRFGVVWGRFVPIGVDRFRGVFVVAQCFLSTIPKKIPSTVPIAYRPSFQPFRGLFDRHGWSVVSLVGWSLEPVVG